MFTMFILALSFEGMKNDKIGNILSTITLICSPIVMFLGMYNVIPQNFLTALVIGIINLVSIIIIIYIKLIR